MQLLLIRHGEAGKRLTDDAPGGTDDQRRLTPRGIRRLRRGVKGLRRLVGRLDAIAHSPLPRAVESAQIAAAVFDAPFELLPDLAPDSESAQRLLEWLQTQPHESTLALVGHEPALSVLAAKLTTSGPAYFELKKGGACLIKLPPTPAAGGATLAWLMTARQLRACR